MKIAAHKIRVKRILKERTIRRKEDERYRKQAEIGRLKAISERKELEAKILKNKPKLEAIKEEHNESDDGDHLISIEVEDQQQMWGTYQKKRTPKQMMEGMKAHEEV